ncbi:hypothetical protein NEOLI_002648 [Neolecta irregularis DAH-3]|uniref:Uncharacterized protein n=1 Tax=Neolecta irregularis (strain DAH-3) TaxID=1198029 RepID=A0A1U7LJH8_NEOID|nr:hypothetical protein NEOLI_002648 [Neolecta irregularis DAH-3]|eukprot:OLL22788.1 hypothetical protein NEOLI_002648 [Neolecta irregularis DAH-3]
MPLTALSLHCLPRMTSYSTDFIPALPLDLPQYPLDKPQSLPPTGYPNGRNMRRPRTPGQGDLQDGTHKRQKTAGAFGLVKDAVGWIWRGIVGEPTTSTSLITVSPSSSASIQFSNDQMQVSPVSDLSVSQPVTSRYGPTRHINPLPSSPRRKRIVSLRKPPRKSVKIKPQISKDSQEEQRFSRIEREMERLIKQGKEALDSKIEVDIADVDDTELGDYSLVDQSFC